MWKYWLLILIFLPGMLLAGEPSVNTDCVPVVTITENKSAPCLDSVVTFHATVLNKGTNSVYKWKRNNVDVGINSADYTAADFHDSDVVTCEYSCKTTCGKDIAVVSNSITVHIINDITPVVLVGNRDSLICEGNLVLFTAEASYGNAIPSYLWMVNDKAVGDTTTYYTTDSLTNGSKVECILTISTPGCPGTRSSTSWMKIYVYPMIHPKIEITPSNTDICRGEQVTFTATANGGAFPSFTWEINSNPTGEVGPDLVISSLKDGDTVSCIITIDQDSRCHSTTSAPSNKVVMHVKDYIDPTLTIAAPVTDACVGTPLSFTATPKNAGDYTGYQWYVNDEARGSNNSTFITDQLANSDKVYCVLSTNIPGCSFMGSATSNDKTVTIRDTPVITFSPPDTSVLSGESYQINASVTGDITSFVWEPGTLLLTPQSLTPLTVPLGETTVFNLSATNVYSCKASSDMTIKVLYKMHMPSAFTPNKDGKNDVFRIPPGSSLSLRQFAVYDRWGHIIFQTSDISKGWDGMNREFELPAGTYIYIIKGTLDNKEVIEKGTVTLIR